MEIAPGMRVGGDYVIERELIRPSRRLARDRGSVWVARRGERNALVALKLLDPAYGSSPGNLHRLDRDLQAAATLATRHTARLFDHGVEGDRPYVAMELLQGEDLATRILRRGRLSLDEAAHLLAEVGDALRCAGEADLVHRGLRPESLFLAELHDEEVVKVLDFGITKDTAPVLAGGLDPIGDAVSLHYLSPEQIRGDRHLDARADLWALGVILFRAVTGQLPFDDDAPSVVVSQILLAPVPRATQLVPELPAALDSFFDRALSRDRARRFRCAAEMIEELSRIAHLSPLSTGALAVANARANPPAPPAAEGSSAPFVAMNRALPEVTDARRTAPLFTRMAQDTQIAAHVPERIPEPPALPGRARRLGAVAVLGVTMALTTLRLRGSITNDDRVSSAASLPPAPAAGPAPVASLPALPPASAVPPGFASPPAATTRSTNIGAPGRERTLCPEPHPAKRRMISPSGTSNPSLSSPSH